MSRHIAVLAFFVLVAAVWSWPAPLLDPLRLPVRHFDLWPVLWLLDRAPHIGWDLVHDASAWPQGEKLARLDSWILLALGWALRPWLSATSIACLVAWLGPALSAFAAERAASALGAVRPWTLAAGLAYGLSGVAASAALEGHVAHLLEPWLPLTLAAGWLAGEARSRSWTGLLAGLCASLALLTTAYHGLVAGLLLLVLALRAGRQIGRFWPAALCFGLTVLWLAWTFSAGAADQLPPRRALELAVLGSTSVSTLLTWTPAVDLLHHSVSAPTGGLVLAALCLGFRQREDRVLLGLAFLGALLSLGPELRLSPDGAWLPSPLAPLWRTPLGAVLRFPVRFAWLTALCGGIVLARQLTRCFSGRFSGRFSARARWAGLVVLGIAVLDPFLSTGMPGRQGVRALPGRGDLPGRATEEGAVLDLFPVSAWPSQSDIEMQARTRSCVFQLTHQRPILTRCIGTSVSDPRLVVSAWLLPRLMTQTHPSPGIAHRLASLGIGEVVLHSWHFQPEDLLRLESALGAALGEPRPAPDGCLRYSVAEPSLDRLSAARALGRLR